MSSKKHILYLQDDKKDGKNIQQLDKDAANILASSAIGSFEPDSSITSNLVKKGGTNNSNGQIALNAYKAQKQNQKKLELYSIINFA